MSDIILMMKLERTISDSGDEGGHAVKVKVRTAGAALGDAAQGRPTRLTPIVY